MNKDANKEDVKSCNRCEERFCAKKRKKVYPLSREERYESSLKNN